MIPPKMRIQYHGEGPVDIPGANFVEHDDVVEVTEEVGASLLLAGSTVDEDNNVVYADEPLWTAAAGMPLSPTGEEKRAAKAAEAADEALAYKPQSAAERRAAAAAARDAAENVPPAAAAATSEEPK